LPALPFSLIFLQNHGAYVTKYKSTMKRCRGTFWGRSKRKTYSNS